MNQTLLLDNSYQAIKVISWKKAISLYYLNKAEIVEEYDDIFLRSINLKIKMPAVIKLIASFKRSKKRVKFSRTNIFIRDKFRCQYCNTALTEETVTFDHIIPRSKNGKSCWTNIVSCCKKCNLEKGNKTLKEANMRLLLKPIEPIWLPIFNQSKYHHTVPSKWKNYCYLL